MTDTQELSETLDLENYLENEGITFKVGRGHSGRQLNLQECPKCGRRKWRVYLNADTGLGNCFSCGIGFNKMSFIHYHLGEPKWSEVFDHVKAALRDQGWRPKRMTTAAVEDEKAKLPPSFPLPTPAGENLLYLEQRGVNGELAKHFHLRFCNEGWWNFKKEDGSTGGQKFDMRIIIPVYDLDGEFVTFQGRDITGTAENKYLFPKGLPGTGRYLLNGRNAIGVKRVCIGEGAFDVIATKAAFDEEVDLRGVACVGTFGKHLSAGDPTGNDQVGRFLRLKRMGLEEATFMWDGESEALVAALAGAKLLTRIGIKSRIALLPRDKDPNEVGGAVVRQAYRDATLYTPALEVKWRLRNPYA